MGWRWRSHAERKRDKRADKKRRGEWAELRERKRRRSRVWTVLPRDKAIVLALSGPNQANQPPIVLSQLLRISLSFLRGYLPTVCLSSYIHSFYIYVYGSVAYRSWSSYMCECVCLCEAAFFVFPWTTVAASLLQVGRKSKSPVWCALSWYCKFSLLLLRFASE